MGRIHAKEILIMEPEFIPPKRAIIISSYVSRLLVELS